MEDIGLRFIAGSIKALAVGRRRRRRNIENLSSAVCQ